MFTTLKTAHNISIAASGGHISLGERSSYAAVSNASTLAFMLFDHAIIDTSKINIPIRELALSLSKLLSESNCKEDT